ncbi:adenine phosphoribosyltransferase [Flavobacteriaceae bacterium Ap0902]|nr:adenine phosphoribosyltransferase [Flavobacteriaceae bacterium Ap0902]
MDLQQEIENHIRIVEDFPKEGVSFKDFTPIFQNPQLSKKIIKTMADPFRDRVDVVCGIESRGFILGFALALELNVPFVLVRKEGKLPPPVEAESYSLEYGDATLEMVQGQVKDGANVLIHDDVLATGGTAKACALLAEKLGGKVAGFSFLIELSFLNGKEKLKGYDHIHSLLTYD